MAKTKRIEDVSGSGRVEKHVDIENMKFSVDFSGIEVEEVYDLHSEESEIITSNFYNSECVLFYVSNSYFMAYRAIYKHLLQKIDIYKENSSNSNLNQIYRHILPYYYCFRHYVETELKSLSIATKRISVLIEHDLSVLLEDVIEGVNNLSLDFKTIKPKKGQEILELKKELISHLMQLKLLILEYKKIEPTPEYFRYIIDSDFICRYPNVELDLNYTENLFGNIIDEFKKIEKIMFNIVDFSRLV